MTKSLTTADKSKLLENRLRHRIRKLVEQVLLEGSLRVVKVTYANGLHITTSVAAGLSDDQIYSYFKVGSKVNIGNGANDRITTIKKVEILPDESTQG